VPLQRDRAAKSLKQIGALRDAATDPEHVYVLRSRLRRLLLQAQRDLALELGLRPPRAPGYLELPYSAPPGDREIARIANDLFDASRSICQPSEAFDERWRRGWREIEGRLEELERLLAA
jgi:hypothetical protein